MTVPVYLNARADECAPGVTAAGRRVIRHGGEAYVVIGFYFARGMDGQRDLYYVLRLSDNTDHTLTRASRREMLGSTVTLTTQTDEPDSGTR